MTAENVLRQRLHIQFRTPGTDSGQQLVRIVREQKKHAVFRRFLQNFQQRVLSGKPHVLRPGEHVNFVLRFVGLNVHIRPRLPDQVYRHGLLFRVVHGDEVRVTAIHHLAAWGAAAAGLIAALTEDRRPEQPCQCVLARALRPGDQVEVGDMPFGEAPGQILFQPVVSQQSVKAHGSHLLELSVVA